MENLLSVALGSTVEIIGSGGGGANTSDYMRSLNLAVLPGVSTQCAMGGNGNVSNAIGCAFYVQKYSGTRNQGNAYVWFIDGLGSPGDLLDTPTVDLQGFRAGQWTAFNAVRTASVPAPHSIWLLATGLAVLFVRRRT
jgi:hypothetical protein